MDDTALWIFAYGSLMWRPDFDFVERHRAVLPGHSRALCIWSHYYRGTPERPGLVFGLDRGGSCIGVAFRIAPETADATLGAVRLREQVTAVYREIRRPVTLADGRTVEAVAYEADPDHTQYAGTLDLHHTVRVVADAEGATGTNRDYVLQTQAHLLDLGVEDETLAHLCARLGEHRAADLDPRR